MYVEIPPDHAERGVVPICISDVDYEGRRVIPAWIEAVKPIASRLRTMTSSITGTVLLVSQVTEEAVHSLSAREGENLGRDPSSRVYSSAKWRALDFKAGGARSRKGIDVEFRDTIGELLQYQPAFANQLEIRNLVERLRSKALELGKTDLAVMMDLHLSESLHELPGVFGIPANSRERNTLTKRFYRGIRDLFESL